MKPKTNQLSDETKSLTYDRCQTPAYALTPLLRHIPTELQVWEPASGEGNIVKTLEYFNYTVTPTDLLTGQNFFHYSLASDALDCQITNPPFSIKYEWLAQSYELGLPFALLMPVETIGAARAQRLFDNYGIEIIYMDKRINFKMPSHKTWEETLKPTIVLDDSGEPVYIIDKKTGELKQKLTSGAQFPTAWFTHGFNFGKEMIFETVERVLMGWEKTHSALPLFQEAR